MTASGEASTRVLTNFPTAAVSGNFDRAEIRPATCGGAFDQSGGHYADNIVASFT